MNDYTMTTVIDDLNRRGFTGQFVVEKGSLREAQTRAAYDPSAITVESAHRFEGPSSPDDEAIVFALTADDGTRGTLIAGFGPASADTDMETIRALMMNNHREGAAD